MLSFGKLELHGTYSTKFSFTEAWHGDFGAFSWFWGGGVEGDWFLGREVSKTEQLVGLIKDIGQSHLMHI